MSCCPDTSWKNVTNVSSSPVALRGENVSIGESNTQIYYTESTGPSTKAIVLFPDVYGITDRMRLIGDSFAQHGFHVIAVDCFHGETADNNSKANMLDWIGTFPWPGVLKDLNEAYDFLSNKGVEKDSIAAVGFCWGGWAIAKSSAEGFRWKCAVSPHPSTKIERIVFGDDETEMLAKVDMPFLLMPAGNDEDNLKPGSEDVHKLEQKGGKSVLFERMIHGWVTRGDLNETDVKEDAEKALKITLDFIENNFAK